MGGIEGISTTRTAAHGHTSCMHLPVHTPRCALAVARHVRYAWGFAGVLLAWLVALLPRQRPWSGRTAVVRQNCRDRNAVAPWRACSAGAAPVLASRWWDKPDAAMC